MAFIPILINLVLILIPISLILIPIMDFDDFPYASAKSNDHEDKDDDDKNEDDEEKVDKKNKKKSKDKDKDDEEKEDKKEKKDKKTKKNKENKKEDSSKDDKQPDDRPEISSKEKNDYDIFGIKKIYPTALSGEEWFLNMENPLRDDQFSPFNLNIAEHDPNFELYQNSDGSWKLKSRNSEAKVRMDVFTSDGYHPENIKTFDHSELYKKGFMQSEKDWKNVEITGYIKLNNYNIPLDEGKFTWYNRGGHHTASNPCEGVGYKGSLYFSGDVKFSKEQWHVSYFFTDIKKGIGSIKDKWIGYKFMAYNMKDPSDLSETYVKIESWIDKNNEGNWIKIDEYIDDGSWGKSGKKCDGKKDQIITWGGPISTFRWDRADDVDFKYLSVREIEPPIIHNERIDK